MITSISICTTLITSFLVALFSFGIMFLMKLYRLNVKTLIDEKLKKPKTVLLKQKTNNDFNYLLNVKREVRSKCEFVTQANESPIFFLYFFKYLICLEILVENETTAIYLMRAIEVLENDEMNMHVAKFKEKCGYLDGHFERFDRDEFWKIEDELIRFFCKKIVGHSKVEEYINK